MEEAGRAYEPTHRFEGPCGLIAYDVAGPAEGPPLILVHSVNAAAGGHEMKPLFARMSRRHRVFALDLPGFGASERPALRYDIPLYTDALSQFVAHVRALCGRAPSMVALSLGAEFAARAVTRDPEAVHRLCLLTPTGFEKGSESRTQDGSCREMPLLSWLLERRPWSRPLFDLLTRPFSVRYFLRRTFGGDTVPNWLVDDALAAARAPGAEHAPLAFLSGRLFAGDVRSLYGRLELLVWVAHGTRGDFADFSARGWAEARSNWRFTAYDSGAMPHIEHPERMADELASFLEEP